MINEIDLNAIHSKIDELRRINRVSYSKMAQVIDYSGEGLNKALKKNTLSIVQINKLVDHFGYSEDFNDIVPTLITKTENPPINYNKLTKSGIRQVSLTILENENLFLEDVVFNTWYEKVVAQEALKLLAEIYPQAIMKK